MVSLLLGLGRVWFAIRKAWGDPSFRSVALLTLSLLVIGTWVFHQVEGWSYLDSFYFSAISLATVGYGDFTPKTDVGKLLTVFYIFTGFGLLATLLTRFADALIQSERENSERRQLLLQQAQEKIAAYGAGGARPDLTEPVAAQPSGDDQSGGETPS